MRTLQLVMRTGKVIYQLQKVEVAKKDLVGNVLMRGHRSGCHEHKQPEEMYKKLSNPYQITVAAVNVAQPDKRPLVLVSLTRKAAVPKGLTHSLHVSYIF